VSDAEQLADSCRESDEPIEDTRVVPLPAEIDIANVGHVRDLLLAQVLPGRAAIIADLSGTSFCDCAGVSALIEVGAHAARSGAELRVVANSRSVLRTFELAGLRVYLPVYPTVTLALADTRIRHGSRPLADTVPDDLSDRRRTGPD
jgi:anti-anti-sigma factor